MLKIKDVEYESDYWGGCETCDYGSSYISNIKIFFENEENLFIETSQMYEYMLSESDYIKILGTSNTKEEIILKVLDLIKNTSYEIEYKIFREDMKIKINEKEIDILQTLKKRKVTYIN